MVSTKIELAAVRISQIARLDDLAKALFPGNTNHQHAFLVIWVALRWKPEGIEPNLATLAYEQGVTRRTFERVRAKMRRLGLIQFVSRFDRRFGNREGWILSTRFERTLEQLKEHVAQFRDIEGANRQEDEQLIENARKGRKAINL